MIKLKTNLSFGFILERKDSIKETRITKSISKLLVVAKEIVSRHHGMVMAENGEAGLRLTLCFPKIDANRKINI